MRSVIRSSVALGIATMSFILIDLEVIRKRPSQKRTPSSIAWEYGDKKVKNKKTHKKYKNRKYKKKRRYLKKHFKLKGTRSKDHRYSNQKKLRRMFRGV